MSSGNIELKRECDVCSKAITKYPLYHCVYCGLYDVCSVTCLKKCSSDHELTIVPVQNEHDFEVLLHAEGKAGTRTCPPPKAIQTPKPPVHVPMQMPNYGPRMR